MGYPADMAGSTVGYVCTRTRQTPYDTYKFKGRLAPTSRDAKINIQKPSQRRIMHLSTQMTRGPAL